MQCFLCVGGEFDMLSYDRLSVDLGTGVSFPRRFSFALALALALSPPSAKDYPAAMRLPQPGEKRETSDLDYVSQPITNQTTKKAKMPKRKNPFTNPPSKSQRLTHPSTATTTTTTLPARAHAQVTKSLTSALPTYHKRIFRVLKKARGFETVKLIRRIKSSRTSIAPTTGSTARLEAELEVLKKLKLDVLARAHLRRCVGRDGKCVRSGVFDWGVWGAEGAGEDGEVRGMGKVELDVCARLYGGKAVREVMGDVLEGVRRILGVDEGEEVVRVGGDGEEGEGKRKIEERLGRDKGGRGVKEKRRKKEEEDEEEDEEEGEEEEEEEEEVESASLPVSASDDDDDSDSESEHEEEEGEDQEDVWKGIDSAGLDAFSAFDSRVAFSSSASSSESESESDAGPYHHATEEDWSTSSAPKSKSKPTQKLGTSTFLPTLLAGYISDSCSSTSSTTSPKHKKGPPEKKQRKNRMGQQARRALWEKKYGQNAAHLKQEAQRKERKVVKEKKMEGQTEGKLHPSWEAARKAREGKMVVVQEVLKSGSGGKKVVFD